jgi:hypothetical protein
VDVEEAELVHRHRHERGPLLVAVAAEDGYELTERVRDLGTKGPLRPMERLEAAPMVAWTALHSPGSLKSSNIDSSPSVTRSW